MKKIAKIWVLTINVDGDTGENQVALYGHKPTEEEFREEVASYLGEEMGETEMRFEMTEHNMRLFWGRWDESWARVPLEGTIVTS